MKNFLSIVVCALFTFALQAQITGGAGGSKPQTPKENSGSKSKSLWKNRFHVLFSLDQARGKWSEAVDPNMTIEDAYLQNSGFGATKGNTFELGSVFYLKQVPQLLGDKLKFGINVSYLNTSIMRFEDSWKELGTNFRDANYLPFFMGGLKLGVTSSYTPFEKGFVDLYFNLNPTYMLGGFMESNYFSSGSASYYDFSVESVNGFGNRFNLGLNFRYGAFLLGLESTFGNINMKGYMYTTEYSNNGANTIVDKMFESTFNTRTFKFRFGFSF